MNLDQTTIANNVNSAEVVFYLFSISVIGAVILLPLFMWLKPTKKSVNK